MKLLETYEELKRKHQRELTLIELILLSALIYGVIKSGIHLASTRSWLDV